MPAEGFGTVNVPVTAVNEFYSTRSLVDASHTRRGKCTYRGVRVVDGAGPVAGVLDVRDVRRRVRDCLNVFEGARHAGARAARDTLREAGRDREGGGGEKHGGQEGGGEHGGSKTRACVGSSWL